MFSCRTRKVFCCWGAFLGRAEFPKNATLHCYNVGNVFSSIPHSLRSKAVGSLSFDALVFYWCRHFCLFTPSGCGRRTSVSTTSLDVAISAAVAVKSV